MAQREQHPVLKKGGGVLLHGEVGGVRDVEPVLLCEPDERVLVREEVRRTVAVRVRAIERRTPARLHTG